MKLTIESLTRQSHRLSERLHKEHMDTPSNERSSVFTYHGGWLSLEEYHPPMFYPDGFEDSQCLVVNMEWRRDMTLVPVLCNCLRNGEVWKFEDRFGDDEVVTHFMLLPYVE